MKTIDIFSAKYCWWVFGMIAVFLILDILLPSQVSSILWMIFFLILGTACLWNYKNCGRVHCKITGIGFIGISILILLTTIGILPLTDVYLNITVILVIIIGYSFEFVYKSKTGSCYKKR